MDEHITLSVIAPVFNGEKTIVEFILRTENTLRSLRLSYEMLLVDDGSNDDSLKMMQRLQQEYPALVIVKLQQNYGQSNAIAAGLSLAKGNFIVVMDSDLQDKPEDIIPLYNKLEKANVDMIIATRPEANVALWRNLGSIAFYQLSRILTRIKHPHSAGVFRIMNAECLVTLPEMLQKPGTILSQMHAAGISWKTISLPRDNRAAQKSNYTFRDMIKLALSRLLPFNRLPLQWLGKSLFKCYVPQFKIAQIFREQDNV
ncbi:MAG: glycosyltransferase family 2 protein [Candidatus Cloacimonetes bacterium]|nr:glycosyltransferase family 2 protein [Candidatus Cloacimonadota bacterium]